MGQIQSNVGLVTGLDIGTIVDKLMAIRAQTRDAITTRNETLKKQQTAITELEALLYSFKYISSNLGKEGVYNKVDVTSSNTNILSVKSTGTPAVGLYKFTALRKAQNQQLLSSGVKSLNDTLGTGKLSFRFGDNVQSATKLKDLNGGEGFTRGKIQITDRSGTHAEIDLSNALSIDDILKAINENTTVNVTAEMVDDHIKITDNTGQTVSRIIVQEVGTGTTAASLGLAGINAASNTAQGQDIIYLSKNISLDAINDGMGVRADTILSDIQYTLRDGTQGEIDLSEILSGGSEVNKEQSLGELMDKINAAAPGKLKIEIASDGQRLVLTDMTTGTNSFAVSSINDSKVLEDLGLTGTATNGVVRGSRIISGGKTVLLSSLNGGNGLGDLGLLSVTDRNGASADVILSDAETLEDVVNAINDAPVQITAQINKARNGIELVDTSGGSGNLIVANGDETNSADQLKIAVNSAANSVNSGDMHLQIIGMNTRLADLNGGAGVAKSKFIITDSTGKKTTINVTDSIETVGDLIKEINLATTNNILAEINETGDGIVIHDTNNGPVAIKVEDAGSTTAKDLNLLSIAKKVVAGTETTQTIDGSMTRTIDLAAPDSQIIDTSTKLAELNGGTGIARGKFRITNSKGVASVVDLTDTSIQSVGDLITTINSLSTNVKVSINSTMDGLLIQDYNNGGSTLKIEEIGSTTAADLNLLGTVTNFTEDGKNVQQIDGATTGKIINYTLDKLRNKINQLNMGVTASVFSDGSDTPYRLSLTSNQMGAIGEFVLDTSQFELSFDEISQAQDALLSYGQSNVLVSSHTNSFTEVLAGATINIENVSSDPVTVNVSTSNTDLLANIKGFVENYNKFRQKLLDDTAFDTASNSKSVLTGDNICLQLDMDMSRLISDRYSNTSTIQSLAQIGISMKDDGTLVLDESKLNGVLTTNRDDVKQLFTAKYSGVSAKFDKVIERLAGPDDSLLELRNKSLMETMEHNQTRIDLLDATLEKERNRMLLDFYNMELAVSKLQSNLTALDSIKWITESNYSSNNN